MAVIGPDQCDAARALVSAYQAGLAASSDDQIERMMTKLALCYPNGKLSDPETGARLELYIELLRDIPFDLLSPAFKRVAQASKFFPTVAEIREQAAKPLAERIGRVNGLKMLIHKHEREWTARADATPMTAEEVLDANAEFERMGLRTRFREDGTTYQAEIPAPSNMVEQSDGGALWAR